MNIKTFDEKLKKKGWDIDKLKKDKRVEKITKDSVHFKTGLPHNDELLILPFDQFLVYFEQFDLNKYTITDFRKLLKELHVKEEYLLSLKNTISLQENEIEQTCKQCNNTHIIPFQYFAEFHMQCSMQDVLYLIKSKEMH